MEKKISFLVSVMWEIKMCVYNLFFLSPDCKESRSLRETKRKMSLSLSLCSLFPFLQKCPTFEIASFIPVLVHFPFLFCLHHTPPLPWGEVKPLFSFSLFAESPSLTADISQETRRPPPSPPLPQAPISHKKETEKERYRATTLPRRNKAL